MLALTPIIIMFFLVLSPHQTSKRLVNEKVFFNFSEKSGGKVWGLGGYPPKITGLHPTNKADSLSKQRYKQISAAKIHLQTQMDFQEAVMYFTKFSSAKKLKMRDSLFGYMMILTIVILTVIAVGMAMLGTFTKTSKKIEESLLLQADLFEKDIENHHRELVLRSADVSSDISFVIENYLSQHGASFEDIENSPQHAHEIQHIAVEILADELHKADTSGIFMVLDSRNNENQTQTDSQTALYLRKSSRNIGDDALLLFRGNAEIAKESGIMQHPGWKYELDAEKNSIYKKLMETESDLPIESLYHFSNVCSVSGIGQKVAFVSVPIRSNDGKTIGVCGFEINSEDFMINHAQTSIINNLMCLWSPRHNELDFQNALVCGTENEQFNVPTGALSMSPKGQELTRFDGNDGAYIGVVRTVKAASGDVSTLAVMIPKQEYDASVRASSFQIALFLVVLCLLAVLLCRVLSKKFIAPITKGLEQIRLHEHSDSKLYEMDDLFAFLAEKDREIEIAYNDLSREKETVENELSRVQGEIEKLAYSRKSEINPDDYQNFVEGIKTLTKSECKIFKLYLDGKTAKDIQNIMGIKESTLKFHNSNIYEKLGVTSRKQLLRYAALYSLEDKNNF